MSVVEDCRTFTHEKDKSELWSRCRLCVSWWMGGARCMTQYEPAPEPGEMSAKMSRATLTASTESAKTGAKNVTTVGGAEGGE